MTGLVSLLTQQSSIIPDRVKTLESISIKHQSDTIVSYLCFIDVDPRGFAIYIWDAYDLPADPKQMGNLHKSAQLDHI